MCRQETRRHDRSCVLRYIVLCENWNEMARVLAVALLLAGVAAAEVIRIVRA